VRLGALGSGRLAGRDIEPSLDGKGGLFGCKAGPLRHDWDYLQRTTCKAGDGARVSLPLAHLKTDFTRGATLIVRLRRADAADATELSLTFAEHALPGQRVDASWAEQRFDLDPAWLRSAQATLQLHVLSGAAQFELDHALVVPKLDVATLTASGVSKAAHDAQRIE
jgi:hypothetical protein